MDDESLGFRRFTGTANQRRAGQHAGCPGAAGFFNFSYILCIKMTDLENLTLEHLRAIRVAVDRLGRDNSDIKATLNILRAYIADQNAEQSHLNARIVEHDQRLARIEQRLELRDE